MRAHPIVAAAVVLLLGGCAAPGGRARRPDPLSPASPAALSRSPAASGGRATPGELPTDDAPTASQLLAGADPTDATAVGATFARLSWTLDTAVDDSELTAEARLAPLMTPELAAQVGAGGTAGGGATILLWRSHRATTAARERQSVDPGAPADTAIAAYRSFVITVTPTGRDGWVGPTSTEIEFLTLSRSGAGQPWLIAHVA